MVLICVNPNQPRTLCAKFEIGRVVLEKKISKFRQYTFAISLLSPSEKSVTLNLNNIESPLPEDVLYRVWLKLAKWFLRRRFLNFVNVFSLFRNYLPLEKGVALYFNKLGFPSPQDALSQVLLKLAQQYCRRRFFEFLQCFFVTS